MKTIFSMLALLAMSFSSAHCNAEIFTLSGVMDVFQATTNAANTGNGFGEIFGTYDDVSKEIEYTATWQDLTSDVTNMHFHVGAIGVAGGVDLAVLGPWSSPQVGSATLDAGQEANLLGGLWYLNVHTTDFGGGEIRGQVSVTAVPEPGSAAICALAMFGMCVRRRRSTT